MSQSPVVLLLDDGELDDVQTLLDDCRISYGRVRGGAIVANTPAPKRLLITTPRRIGAVSIPDSQTDELMRIVVASEDSRTLRSQLRAVGFDYLIRRPVHPEALRLLLLHCIYGGDERRTESRVPIGFEVSFRTGLVRRKAVLVDLSTRGCRILSNWAIEPGKRIKVTIPETAGGSEAITVKGHVVRITLDENLSPDGRYGAAIAFDAVPDKALQEIEWILAERARGPATLQSNGGDDASPRETPLDSPETRDANGMMHGFSVEVDVRMDASTAQPLAEPVLAPIHGLPSKPEPGSPEPPAAAENETAEIMLTRNDLAPASADPHGERRDAQRGAYPVRVPAFGEQAMRVLVARDLSVRGMRVEKESGLEVGDRLHLAVYADANEEPLLVWGTVSRDDGDAGMALVFDPVHPTLAEKLEKVVADLPAVESLHDDEARAMGTVVTEILDT